MTQFRPRIRSVIWLLALIIGILYLVSFATTLGRKRVSNESMQWPTQILYPDIVRRMNVEQSDVPLRVWVARGLFIMDFHYWYDVPSTYADPRFEKRMLQLGYRLDIGRYIDAWEGVLCRKRRRAAQELVRTPNECDIRVRNIYFYFSGPVLPVLCLFATYPVLVATIASIRIVIRKRRNECLSCGYRFNQTGTGRCSECGCERSKSWLFLWLRQVL